MTTLSTQLEIDPTIVKNNIELCKTINVAPPKGEHQNFHEYQPNGIQVYVYK